MNYIMSVIFRFYRLDPSESLINGHITPASCVECGLPMPAICDCDGKKRNSCGRLKKFKSSRGALFDAPAALSCYTDDFEYVVSNVVFSFCSYQIKFYSRRENTNTKVRSKTKK